ncbi:MAG TPA: hydrogen gas-evolving membrane-bound hydrogenase subunit E [Iamia sp.]|nr:hydrogen gas-evolving membrane-bound hydrogenase subunit E [Iamia sp.]
MGPLVLLHLAAAAVVFAAGRHLGRRGLFAVALVAPVATVAWAVTQVGAVLDGATPAERTGWVPSIDVALSFRLDGFALLMALVVAGMGTLVLAWSVAYFGADQPIDRLVRFAGGFVAFAGAMLGLVLADDVWTLFVFWEATSITSFVLIGLDHDQPSARAAAQRALLITAAGGLALMGGLVLISQAAGTTSLAGLAADPPGGTVVTAGLVLVLVGAATKSAQVPFQVWLPGAMAAPTPVSAFLHSATMVKAGVIVVGRFAPVFADLGWWRPVVVGVGALTMVAGGIGALRQHDAKLLLAHGTVSQLGFMVVAFGIGHPDVTAAAVALLVGHALFKAALFLTVGIVDHATGTRDIRRLGGVGRALPGVAALAAIAAGSMAGLPPALGFVAKEAVLDTLLHEDDPWALVAVVAVALGSILTVAYTARLWWGLFGAGPATERAEVHHRPGPVLVLPVALLTGLTLLGGLFAGPLGDRLAVAGEALDPHAHGHLVLWAGVTAPLAISIGIVVAGAVLHLVLRRVGGVPAARVSGEHVFQRGFDGLLDGARRVTAVVQNGSLPAYLAVVWLVVVAGGVGALATGARIGDVGTVVADNALQVAVVAVTIGMTIGVAVARRRFSSVLLLGGVGYGTAVLFMLHGAPDLALTQLLVETMSLVVFLLVLRQLPEGYAAPPEWAPRTVRIGIAVAAGLAVAGLAAVAGTTRSEAPVADEYLARSEPEAGGRNVVNVVLVDFRGIDTLGEITVLAVAAIGVANLVRAARRDLAPDEDEDPLDAPLDDGPSAAASDDPTVAGDRSVIFDVVGRGLFPVLLLVSIYVALRGHNAPGGGFAGGLIAGGAFLMRFLAAGTPRLARARPLPTSALVGTGLLVAAGTGAASLAAGQDFLESTIWKLHPPLLGEVKLVTSTVFDVGVYLLVLGVVLSVLTHLGAGPGLRPVRGGAR